MFATAACTCVLMVMQVGMQLSCRALVPVGTQATGDESTEPATIALAQYKRDLAELDKNLIADLKKAWDGSVRRRKPADSRLLQEVIDAAEAWSAEHQVSPPASPWIPLGVSWECAPAMNILNDYAKKLDRHRREYLRALMVFEEKAMHSSRLSAERARQQGDLRGATEFLQQAQASEDLLARYRRHLDGMLLRPVLCYKGDECAMFRNGVKIAQLQGAIWAPEEPITFFPGDVIVLAVKSQAVYRSFRCALVGLDGEGIHVDSGLVRVVEPMAAPSYVTTATVAEGAPALRGRNDDAQDGHMNREWARLGMSGDASEWVGLPEVNVLYWFAFVLP